MEYIYQLEKNFKPDPIPNILNLCILLLLCVAAFTAYFDLGFVTLILTIIAIIVTFALMIYQFYTQKKFHLRSKNLESEYVIVKNDQIYEVKIDNSKSSSMYNIFSTV